MDQSAAPADTGSTRRLFAERSTVPLWWWPVALVVLIPVAIELHMSIRSFPVWLTYLILLPVPIWTLLWMGRHRLEVTAPRAAASDPTEVELRVGQAHLPTSFIARAAVVPASAKSAALGRQLDPAAFVSHRPWIGPMVLLVLNDPEDPTPYWLVSTRNPERVLAALGCS
jgi:hypothetical protein